MSYPATAAIVREPGGAFTLETVDLDSLHPHEVLVRIAACGICHTDLKFQSRLPLPGVFGHEGTGTVEAVGAEVDQVSCCLIRGVATVHLASAVSRIAARTFRH